jgi:hypothetical protein
MRKKSCILVPGAPEWCKKFRGITRWDLGLVRNGFTHSAKTLFWARPLIGAAFQGEGDGCAAKTQRKKKPGRQPKKNLASHKKHRYYSLIGC